MEAEARRTLAQIPALAGYDGPLERLGGLTNAVFRAGDAVVRLPGRGTEEYIDRANEAIAAREAAAVGVSPELIFVDSGSGVMVTRFIEGAETMSPERFRTRPGAPERAGEAFRRLHDSGARFPVRFELFAMINDYLRLLSTKDVALPEGYHDVVAAAEEIRHALDASAVAPVACHCDPLCENLLDTGARMWIVDWEYAGMNDPLWDLGDLAVEGGFDDAAREAMIQAYFGREPRPEERGRIVIYQAMCDLLWTLWGLIQHANDNPAEDFWAYSVNRFARCKALMASPEFPGHVTAVHHAT
jgi:thiamine kinase-like enzyme